MTLKQITLLVVVCLSVALAITLVNYPYGHMSSNPKLIASLAALILRDGGIILFLVYLYRRS
jgi:hypothetical protein